MGGCCAKMVEFGKGITAYGTMMFVNYTIFAMGLVMVSLGIYSLTTYGDDSFFSRELYALMIVFGLMTFGLVYLACIGGRDPKERPNYLFCYWCLISILLIGNAVGFFYFKTFVKGIDSTDSSSGEVTDALRISAAKEFQDFILSTYTTCCTGCDSTLVESCAEDVVASDKNGGEIFCVNSIVNDGVNVLGEGECFFAEPCSQEQLTEQFEAGDGSTGLGLGCYTFLQEIPGFDVSSDTCTVLKDLEVDGKPLVGPASNGDSCGGGDPQDYVDNVVQYFDDHYYLIAVPWGLLMGLLGLGWVSSVFMIVWFSGGRNKNPAGS